MRIFWSKRERVFVNLVKASRPLDSQTEPSSREQGFEMDHARDLQHLTKQRNYDTIAHVSTETFDIDNSVAEQEEVLERLVLGEYTDGKPKTLGHVNENMECAPDLRLDYILDIVHHSYTFAWLH